MGKGAVEELDGCVAVEGAVNRIRAHGSLAVLLLTLLAAAAAPASAQDCKFLCEPTLLVEPTMPKRCRRVERKHRFESDLLAVDRQKADKERRSEKPANPER
jgi:hypothetical protein